MKAVFFAVALTAVAAVKAGEEEKQEVGLTPEDVKDIFSGDGGSIDWEKFSPDALGMSLNFQEMSEDELKKVVSAFVKLNLISPEEADTFASFLVDPRMRLMLENVTENWPETMQKIIKDPDYLQFLQSFQSNVDEEALAQIVGLKDGLPGAAARAEEQSREGSE
ncbi:hypothetical protein ACSSS7_008054 [Eimeria intestinalis]